MGDLLRFPLFPLLIIGLAVSLLFLKDSAGDPIAPSVLAWLAVIVTVAGFVSWYMRNQRRHVQLCAEVNEAVRLLREGDLEEAASRLDLLCREAVRFPNAHASALSALAAIETLRGNPRRSAELQYASHGTITHPAQAGVVKRPAALGLVQSLAQLGDVQAADYWLTVAEGCDHGEPSPIEEGPIAILLLRAGRYDEAGDLLRSRWQTLTDTLPGHQLQRLHVLRSFAEQFTDSPDPPMQPPPPDVLRRHSYLGASWAEMAAFLDAT